MERKGLKLDKESDSQRIRFNLNVLKKNNPVRYSRELRTASVWKYNKSAPLRQSKVIKKFDQIQPEPTIEEMEDTHLEHRLHLCNLRREKYKRKQIRQKNARDEHI
ncbi:uncharacterized protein FA14DRAFT_162145 [Meira miltonrushii]|uniref:Uncharacterized protein n=1 Tax=Meira miltonrushii TaxID=1280837 RepID=A0A316V9T4_9BASI|nr:uncharacterized protein FA14DRAFT_162145 [Meira miltonrushii]PWN32933.1 hypothetical protein FA14DRAFT_162145 [Meira miltonrushii]